MRKHGLKSSAKRERLLAAAQDEAEEALEKLVRPSFAQLPILCRVVSSNLCTVACMLSQCDLHILHASCALFDTGGAGLFPYSALSAAVFA